MIYNDWVDLIMKEFKVSFEEASVMYKAMLLARDVLRIGPPDDSFMNKPE